MNDWREYLGCRIDIVFQVFLDRIVAKKCKSRVGGVSTTDILSERFQKFSNRRRSVKTDHLYE